MDHDDLKLNAFLSLSNLAHTVVDMMDIERPDVSRATLAQANAISCIMELSPDGVMLKTLAQELGVTPSAASQTVDSLVNEGMVERCVNQADRRAVVIRASKAGLALKERHLALLRKLAKKTFKGISNDDADTFWRVLVEVYGNLRQEKRELQVNK